MTKKKHHHRKAKSGARRVLPVRRHKSRTMFATNPRHHRGFHLMRNRARGRRRSRNPGIVRGGVNLLKYGLYALVGLVVSRQLPQMLLGSRNTGFLGYAANIATAFALSFVGNKFGGPEAGNAMLLGGGLFVVNRAIGDNFAPVQKYLSLSGLGDPLALGDIRPGYFPLPVPLDANNNPIIPSEIDAGRAMKALAAAAPAGGPQMATASRMSGVGSPSGRFGGRF